MFQPSILNPDPLLAPISEDNPAGIDVRWETDDLDQISRAAGPRWAAAARNVTDDVWVTKEESGADWPKVVSLATAVLAQRSKDLVVAVRLAEGLLVRHGIAGLREGLWLIRELLDRYWETMHPVPEGGDLEDRGQAFAFLDDQSWRIGELPVPSGMEPWPELEALLDAATGARDEFLALYGLIQERFGRQTPPVGQLNERLTRYVEAVSDLVERVRPVLAPPEEATAETTDAADASRPAARTRGPVMTAEPADVADAAERLLMVASYLRRQDPRAPLAYRLSRVAHWSDSRALTAEPPSQSDLSAPPTEARIRIRDLEASSSWIELLEASEEAMCTVAGRFWLDPNRSSVVAMENLGEEYSSAIQAVRRELRDRLLEFAAAPTLTLSDFTPAASPETRQWLNRYVMSDVPTAPPAGAEASAPDEDAELWAEADASLRAGLVGPTLDLLRERARKAVSERDAFLCRLRTAELCVDHGLARLATPILEGLAEEVDHHHLDRWEPIELSARVFAALHACYRQSDGGDREVRVHESFSRLCRLDPGRAFRTVND